MVFFFSRSLVAQDVYARHRHNRPSPSQICSKTNFDRHKREWTPASNSDSTNGLNIRTLDTVDTHIKINVIEIRIHSLVFRQCYRHSHRRPNDCLDATCGQKSTTFDPIESLKKWAEVSSFIRELVQAVRRPSPNGEFHSGDDQASLICILVQINMRRT